MDADPKKVLEEFSALADDDKREVLAELLRMTREQDAPTPEQDELLAAAEEILRRE